MTDSPYSTVCVCRADHLSFFLRFCNGWMGAQSKCQAILSSSKASFWTVPRHNHWHQQAPVLVQVFTGMQAVRLMCDLWNSGPETSLTNNKCYHRSVKNKTKQNPTFFWNLAPHVWWDSSTGKASYWKARRNADAGLIPQGGKGFFSQRPVQCRLS